MRNGAWCALRLAAVALWAAAPASVAALTAGEAYQYLADIAIEEGGLFEPSVIANAPGEVRLEGVRIGVRTSRGSWVLTPEWMNFSERGDGAVEISVPDSIPVEATVFGIRGSFGTWLLSGFTGLITEGEDGVIVSMSGDSLRSFAVISDASLRGGRRLQSNLRTWRAGIALGTGAENSVHAELEARTVELAEQRDDGSLIFRSGFESVRAESDGGLHQLFDLAGEPFGQDRFRTALSFASSESVVFDDPPGDRYFAVRSGPVSGEISSLPGGAASSVTAADFMLQSIDGGEARESAQASNMEIAYSITLGSRRDTAEIAVETDISGVEIDRRLFSANVPEGEDVSFPPARFVIDGSLNLPSSQARRLFAGAPAEFQPFDILTWNLRLLRLDVLGATLTAQGDVTQTALGGPDSEYLQSGRVDAEIRGVNEAAESTRPQPLSDQREFWIGAVNWPSVLCCRPAIGYPMIISAIGSHSPTTAISSSTAW